MLEGLDKVDWGAITESHVDDNRDPAKIPAILRTLSEKGTEKDYVDLVSQITRNGIFPTEAMLYSLPFIFELLGYSDFQFKVPLLHLLYESLASTGRLLGVRDYIGNRLFDAVQNEDAVFFRLFQDRNLDVRFAALDIWELVKKPYDEVMPILVELAELETDSMLRCYTLKYASDFTTRHFVREYRPDLHAPLTNLLLQEFENCTKNRLKTLLSYALVAVMAERVILDAVKWLVDSIISNDKALKRERPISTYQRLHYANPSFYYVGIQAVYKGLYKCGASKARFSFLRILYYKNIVIDWYQQDWIYSTDFRLYVALLDFLFVKSYFLGLGYKLGCREYSRKIILTHHRSLVPKRRIARFKKLDKDQCEFLTWLVNDDRFWEKEHNLLVWYGLPATREKLRKFVEKNSGTL